MTTAQHSAWYIVNSPDILVVMMVIERGAPVNPSQPCSGVTSSVKPSLMLAPSPLQLHLRRKPFSLRSGFCHGRFIICVGVGAPEEEGRLVLSVSSGP